MFEFVLTCSKYIGYLSAICVSIIGVRLLFYFHSFFFHWPRYRQLRSIPAREIKGLSSIPFIKIQITTKGLPDSTRVIRRGIQNVIALAREAPDLYWDKLSVEVVTESAEQKALLETEFLAASVPLQVSLILVPSEYETAAGTKLKARSLHYMVELRRRGFNAKAGRTYIVHYDEESVMEPDELRKLIHYLATTPKPLSEGPIYYPLEYADASPVCRAMEANRPIGCFECRTLMEHGTPLHLHGSNLVVDEDLENTLGWDIGTLDGQPLVAEDYVFGVQAYLRYGPQVFGWHGSVMLEQPPFSLRSAFRQRCRWITGVLQGMALMQRMPEFHQLPGRPRFRLVWATRYRILTFALGLPSGAVSLLYLFYQLGLLLSGQSALPLPLPLMCWLVFVGFLWLNSMLIGAWYNLVHAGQMSVQRHRLEVLRVLTLAPVAGVVESSAGFWAAARWLVGKRRALWHPTPKIIHTAGDLKEEREPRWKNPLFEKLRLPLYTLGSSAVMTLYLVVPLLLLLSPVFPYGWNRLLVACGLVALGELAIFSILSKTTPGIERRALQYSRPGPRPVSFGGRARRLAPRYAAAALTLGISLQWILLSWSSPWAIKGAFPQAASPACIAPGTVASNTLPQAQPAAFQTGVVFPRWGADAYGLQDRNWQVGLNEIKQQTAAQWVGLSINLYQPSLTSTQVQVSEATPTPQAVAEGIREARALNYHVFVFPQLTVGGPRSWAGNIQYPTAQLVQSWFDSYWLAYRPYVLAAAQAGADELAIGTEYELLQPASPALWNQLIQRAHQDFPGKLTYDLNWSSLYYPLPSWLHNRFLSAVGVSVYVPLTETPQRLNPKTLPALWQTTIGTLLDRSAAQMGKPILLSELGYRDSSDALYDPWEISTSAPSDQMEQAAAYNAALSSVMRDPHIAGVFAWAWEFPPFDLRCRLAAQVLHHWYTADAGALGDGYKLNE